MYKQSSVCLDGIGVDWSGASELVDGRAENCHDKYEIICFLGGSGRCLVEGKEYIFSSGSILLLKPLVYHCLILTEGETCEFVTVKFDEAAITSTASKILLRIFDQQEDSFKFYATKHVWGHLYSVFERLEYSVGMLDEQKGEYLRALISEAVVFLSGINVEDSRLSDDELGAKVVRYLNINIEKNISLDKLAKRFFVSKYYLCRAFKKYSGTSIHSYMNHKRIMYAKQLIESGEAASQAAYKVGFGDYSAFYRAYVKIVGKSPTAN